MSESFESEPINLEELGFYFDPVKKCLVWKEELTCDPDSDFCRAIETKIEADDRAFLTACGVKPWKPENP
jgi:hypothetical protein